MVDDRGIRRGVRYKHCTLIEERVRVKKGIAEGYFD